MDPCDLFLVRTYPSEFSSEEAGICRRGLDLDGGHLDSGASLAQKQDAVGA